MQTDVFHGCEKAKKLLIVFFANNKKRMFTVSKMLEIKLRYQVYSICKSILLRLALPWKAIDHFKLEKLILIVSNEIEVIKMY
jgi:hypothetical protein